MDDRVVKELVWQEVGGYTPLIAETQFGTYEIMRAPQKCFEVYLNGIQVTPGKSYPDTGEATKGAQKDFCRRVISCLEESSGETPKGYVLVPVRPTRSMAEAAARAHYGKRRADRSGGIDGISMTVEGADYTFWQAFKKFWRGALSEVRNG